MNDFEWMFSLTRDFEPILIVTTDQSNPGHTFLYKFQRIISTRVDWITIIIFFAIVSLQGWAMIVEKFKMFQSMESFNFENFLGTLRLLIVIAFIHFCNLIFIAICTFTNYRIQLFVQDVTENPHVVCAQTSILRFIFYFWYSTDFFRNWVQPFLS